MRNSYVILLFIIIVLTPPAAADAMFRANVHQTGVYDNGGIVPANNALWQFTTGNWVTSSPAVSDGVVYVGSRDNNLYAIDAWTGQEKWRFITGTWVTSSPAVSNGSVYVGSEDKNLYAIDAVTGKKQWQFATGGGVSSSPTVSNDVVYFGSADKNLYAVDAVTGKEKWRFQAGGMSTSPAVADGVVFAVFDINGLFAIDAVAGRELWNFHPYPGGLAYSSPAIANGVVYFGQSQSHHIIAVDAKTGKPLWEFGTMGWIRSSPAVSDKTVYVGSQDKNLYAIDAVNGKEKWRFTTGGLVLSSPAIADGIVYIGSEDKNLYAIDAVTGLEQWRFTMGDGVDSSPAVANGIVYIGSNDGKLWAIGGAQSTPKMIPTTIPSLLIQSMPTTPSPSATATTNATGALTASGIQNTPSSSLSSDGGGPGLILPGIIVFLILLPAGCGVYYLIRVRTSPAIPPPLLPDHDTVVSSVAEIHSILPQEQPDQEISKPTKNNDLIFISAKSEDFAYAEEVYAFLTTNNYNVFFSQQTLPFVGNSDYRKEIDRALDNAKHMIVVTSKKEYVEAPWVEAEWGFFINEKRSGRKAGNIITLIAGSMQIGDLPGSLRYYEVRPLDPRTLDTILNYLT